jgi:hypothetical protein
MIYITIDTCNWNHSIDYAWKIQDYLDDLEYWIQTGRIKLLLPRVILDEFRKRDDAKIEDGIKSMEEFFKQAVEILPSAFYGDYNNQDVYNTIVRGQLDRIYALMQDATDAPFDSTIVEKVFQLGLDKGAPFGNKNSTADALILYSLYKFINENPGHTYYFVSDNKSDFEKKKKPDGKEQAKQMGALDKDDSDNLNEDIYADFNRLGIQYCRSLKSLNDRLKYKAKLPLNPQAHIVKRKRLHKVIKDAKYNPAYDTFTADQEISFVQNLNTLNFILNQTKPTKEQVLFVLALIDSEEAYNRHFYKGINSNWFSIVKEKGAFTEDYYPDGPLTYLKKLSLEIKEGKGTINADDIIKVITDICETSSSTRWGSWVLIEILSNLPNDKIPKEVLKYLPKWFQGNNQALSETSELCEKLLPKFLNDNPTQEDLEKAEIIVKYLFSVEKNVTEIEQDRTEGSYGTWIYLHFLVDSLIDKDLIQKIAKHCSLNLVRHLAETLRTLYYDFETRITPHFIVNDKKYSIFSVVNDSTLNIKVFNEANEEVINSDIENFETYTKEETKNKMIAILSKVGYSHSDTNDFDSEIFIMSLFIGSYASISYDAIEDLGDIYKRNSNPKDVFALIFRDLLTEKIRQNPNEGTQLLEELLLDKRYRLELFKRITLYAIGKTWDLSKDVFWKYIKGAGPYMFWEYNYRRELYELLKINQSYFTEEENKILKGIIDAGSAELEKKGMSDYSKLRWYSALKDNSYFSNNYNQLSGSVKKTYEDYENQGKVMWGNASQPPIKAEDVLTKSNAEIVKYFHEFKPTDSWAEPNILGLSEVFGLAVQNNPEKFVNEIEEYQEIYYPYAYQLLHSLTAAWNDKKTFDWAKVLNFAKGYISSQKFIKDELKLNNDGRNVERIWVEEEIADLIKAGVSVDAFAYDASLLPLTKEILSILTRNLKGGDMNKIPSKYPGRLGLFNFTYNSTSGKVLHALVHYSLRCARVDKLEGKTPEWDKEITELYESTLQKDTISSFVLLGYYFDSFRYLNQEWIDNKAKEMLGFADDRWRLFFIGLLSTGPYDSKMRYELLYPHYKLGLVRKADFTEELERELLIKQVSSFYYLGFENLDKESDLVSHILTDNQPKDVIMLVQYATANEDYFRALTNVSIEQKTLLLWTTMLAKYENSQVEAEQEILEELLHLLIYAPVLNEEYTKLVLKSCGLISKHIHSHYLLENLVILKDSGVPTETAKNIGEILSAMRFQSFFTSVDNEEIITLVEFLYQNEQKLVANAFCDKMVKQGFTFLIAVYNKYNN